MSFVPPPYEKTYVVAKALISLDSLLLKKMFLKLYSYDGSTVQCTVYEKHNVRCVFLLEFSFLLLS